MFAPFFMCTYMLMLDAMCGLCAFTTAYALQDKLLNRSSVFAYDGSHLRFESKTSEAYARDVLPGKVSTSLSL